MTLSKLAKWKQYSYYNIYLKNNPVYLSEWIG